MRNTDPSTVHKTFWNDQRLAKGLTLKQLAAEIHADTSWLHKVLTGQNLPSTPMSVKICDYFGVDYAQGAAEFNKAHEEWVAAHPGDTKKRSPIRKRKFDKTKAAADVDLSSFNVEEKPTKRKYTRKQTKSTAELVNSVIRKLYGNISCDDFLTIALCEPTVKDLLEYAYNKVDVDTFMELLSASKA
jgi:transcriptional regulator with XRE-family HTH domain